MNADLSVAISYAWNEMRHPNVCLDGINMFAFSCLV